MKLGAYLCAAVAVLLFLGISTSLFIVREDQQAIVTQFGRPLGEPIRAPGPHLKAPWQRTFYFDKRFLEWESEAEEANTSDKVYILVGTYARWRIADPLLYLQRVRDESTAQSRLDALIGGAARSAIANHPLLELIRSSNRTPADDPDSRDSLTQFQEVSIGREKIRQEIRLAAQSSAADLGIEVLDVQFKHIDYGEQVRGDVYNRMISERRRIADRYRSEGQGEASRIRGEMERELKRIQSEAFRKTQETRGRADAEAAEIYAQAYGQSEDERSFYEFTKSMEALEHTLDRDTWLLLTTRGDLYHFLGSPKP